MKQLTVIDGPQIGRTFDLTHVSQASLGSGSRATLRLEGAAIGGIQAQLARQGERLVLSNAHCEIPVFVNGEPLGRDRVLEQGDRIVAANVMLLFHLESGDRDASPEGIALPLIDEPAVAEARVRFHHNAQKLLESFDRTSDPALCFGSLVQVASALMNRLTLEELLPRVLEIVFEVIPADRGAVLLCEAPDRLLRPVATHRRPHAPEIEGQLPVSRTIVAHLLSHREGILTRDAPTDSRFGEEASIDVLGIRSAICVPLVSSDDAVLGVIHLDTTTAERRLEEDHLRLLTGIAVFASMAIENAQMVAEISDRRRLDYELQVAAKIQQSLTPNQPPDVPGLELAGACISAAEIGGDYYDFLMSEDGKLLYTVIGDVSGKGVPAGLVMTMARSYLLGLAGFGSSTRELVCEMNRLLCPDTRREGMFMSLVLLGYDTTLGTFSWTGAGHEHLLIYRAEQGVVERIPAGGRALGLRPESHDTYTQQQLALLPEDVLLLYTDGVTEAFDAEGREFGLEATELLLKVLGRMSPEQIVGAMLLELERHRGTAPQADDLTLVVIKKT